MSIGGPHEVLPSHGARSHRPGAHPGEVSHSQPLQRPPGAVVVPNLGHWSLLPLRSNHNTPADCCWANSPSESPSSPT